MQRTWLGAALVAALLVGGPAAAAVVDPADLVLAQGEGGGGGFPWWLVVLPLAAGAFLALRRPGRRGGPERQGALRDRLARLKALHGRLLGAALQLDEDGRRGRLGLPGRQGLSEDTLTSRTYVDLDRQTLEILTEANALGEELTIAEKALAENRASEAEGILSAVDRRLIPLEAELAAAVTTMAAIADDQAEVESEAAGARSRLAALRGRAVGEDGLSILRGRLADAERIAGEDPSAALESVRGVARALDRLEGRALAERPAITWEELPRHAGELTHRLADLAGAYDATRARAESLGLPGDPEVEGRIDAARRRLGQAPLDLEEAAASVAEARDALRRYQAHLEAAAEREARRPDRTGPMAGGMGPIIMMPPQVGGRGGGGGGGDGASGEGDLLDLTEN